MNSPDRGATDFAVDLTNCDREPIHILGHVQSYGCLLAVSPDWFVAHLSANCQEMLGLDPDTVLGVPLTEFLPTETVHVLRSKLQLLDAGDSVGRIFAFDVFGDGRLFDASLHRSGHFYIFEFEPRTATGADGSEMAMVQGLISRVQRNRTVEDMAQDAARGLKALIGIDRVMVYRFEEDDSGTVIAEAREPQLEAYLGLHYPASDIPKQARELYTRSPLRLIADVNDTPSPVIPAVGPDGKPLDLSLAATRAVSPIHLEYLRNMGVEASLSVSILRRGKLWGLFACHHYAPFYIGYDMRSAVELFAQLFNYELAQAETDLELAEIDRAQGMHDRVLAQMSDGQDLVDTFDFVAREMADVIPFDGIAIFSNGHYQARGLAPTEEEFMGLARFLNTAQMNQVYATDCIAERYPRGADFAERAAGLLALPISRSPRDYIVLFRQEVARTVNWAGNPEKPAEVGPNGVRLTPRKSFEAWQEVVKGRSAAWKPGERRAADALRVTLLEIVLKLTDEAAEARQKANDQQELLIAELNHRVRNILNLIRGLVSQGKGGAVNIQAYGEVLDARIHALARAHDQLTQKEWHWVSLKSLIRTEVRAFLSDKADRVHIAGPDVDLSPTAFTTMALVVHELVTNSAKYGALSDSSGSVDMAIELRPDGGAELGWREKGGPPVQAPTRKGFGTTIIERSVPFELKGTAHVEYKVTGVVANFGIPAAHAEVSEDQETDATEAVTTNDVSDAKFEGTALVVEDNMIIAMDAADMLEHLGASSVRTVASVADALHAIEDAQPTFALVDVNLGDETSLPVAERCKELGVKFVLATGYGASDDIIEAYPGVPILKKPYTIEHIAEALATLF
ncbi:HWE histidine kinase domain-containing protein [Psychromarinibacter halotolerans]|uniref:histidine kinase n=1 Tax=Psychromarinibacter halotolerans TaxID=1775175 RepID=A0ABV7GYB4_9RHOB|nr:HWE histidine kinase domain-containing protein [Psychromarinibacter halotolerans]MDF0596079.1 HWE histidine kinase domain-containing protein [Psychromarinibacter halotolerans]